MTSVPASAPAAPPAEPTGTRLGPVLIFFAIGTAAAVGLGVYGRVHSPTGQAINIAGFSSGLAAKSALTTVAFVLGCVQLVTGLGMFGRIPLRGNWVAPLHRWSGRIAVAFTVPVAVHCLYALGFQTFDTRVAVHSILGCFFFGAFICKMLILTRDDSPGWALPVLGGVVFSGLTALWMTAALWYFMGGA